MKYLAQIQIKWDDDLPLAICAPNDFAAVTPEPEIAIIAAPADKILIPFTYCIPGWTTEQTCDFIKNAFAEYKIQHGTRCIARTRLYKYLTAQLKPHCKRPNINSAREQIAQLC